MMTKSDHVAYWLATADDNWGELHNMARAGDYLPALFWAHLCIEKISKALWVKENEANVPPRIHNIIHLLRATSCHLTPEQTTLVTQLNNFQLEGRYPDHHRRMQKVATAAFTDLFLTEIAALRQCLLAMLL